MMYRVGVQRHEFRKSQPEVMHSDFRYKVHEITLSEIIDCGFRDFKMTRPDEFIPRDFTTKTMKTRTPGK